MKIGRISADGFQVDRHRRLVLLPAPLGTLARVDGKFVKQGRKLVLTCGGRDWMRCAEVRRNSGFRTSAFDDRSDTAHPLALVWPEIELPVIGCRRQVCLIEWHAGAVQIDFTSDTAKSGA
jgi:hypothetical protein